MYDDRPVRVLTFGRTGATAHNGRKHYSVTRLCSELRVGLEGEFYPHA